MRPSARLRTVLALLEAFFSELSQPLDVMAGKHFSANRYIGAKDRRAIQETLYLLIRDYLALAWKVEALSFDVTPKAVLLLHLVEADAFKEGLFGGDQYGLEALNEEEGALIKALAKNKPEAPEWAKLNCPEWLYPEFLERFGDKTAEELQSLNQRAPFTVRLNSLRGKSEETAKELAELGFQPTRYSPLGFTSQTPVALHNHPLFRDGKIEVQDEGSQLAMLLAGAAPGMQVVDLCAGAGGKTLGLAAEMANRGQIYAFDIDHRRLGQLGKRAQKAGVRNIQATVLPADGKGRAGLLQPLSGRIGRVILDLPCSGTGTWRRSPDGRFRLSGEKLKGYQELQKALLAEGAGLVKSGGRLVYITCSLLESEGEAQITGFLGAEKGWKCLDYREILKEHGLRKIPESASHLPGCLLLTPAQHGCDGFFVCVLEKK
ncbi:MAG: RsmB/NOP family class I SAM-dependent RNA methyltransferase [Proteobacteria bacterium]|nr:RsmB/NOP family class I SAM-dependent RNA methyltransferase [Pseudomonadota bacterium]